MSYIDQSYLERRFGPAAISGAVSANNTPSSMTGTLISDIIEEATSYVDSYLAPYYDVPTTAVGIIKGLVADKTYATILIRGNKEVPEELLQRLNDVNPYLQQIKDEYIRLANVDTTNDKDPAGHVFVQTSGSTVASVMGVSNLRGGII